MGIIMVYNVGEYYLEGMHVFMRKVVLFLFVLFSSLTLVACNLTEGTDEPSITGISVNVDDIQGDFLLDVFDLSDVRLIVSYDDGSTATINLTEAMISSQDIQRLDGAGTHTITVTYGEQTTTFTITLTEPLDGLAVTLLAIYELGVEAGEIPVSYDEWISSFMNSALA